METLPLNTSPIEVDNTPVVSPENTMSVADTPPIIAEPNGEELPAVSIEMANETTPPTDNQETTTPSDEVSLEGVDFEAPIRVVDDQGNVSVIIAQLGPDGLIIPDGYYRFEGDTVAYVDNPEQATADRGEQQTLSTATSQPKTPTMTQPVATTETRELPVTGTETAPQQAGIAGGVLALGAVFYALSKMPDKRKKL